MLKLNSGLRVKWQQWRHRASFPGWVSLSRERSLSSAEVLAGVPGFYEMQPAGLSHSSVPIGPKPEFLSRQEWRWAQVCPQVIPALGCFVLSDVCCGGQGYVYRGNRICREDMVLYPDWQRLVWDAPWVVPARPAGRVRRLDRPLLWFISRDHYNYGHWWLDLLPRLYLIREMHPEWLDLFVIAIPDDLPGWAADTLTQLFGLKPSQLIPFAHDGTEFLSAPFVVLPTMVHLGHHFHPAAADFYLSVTNHCLKTSLPEKSPDRALFVTRRTQARTRILRNIEDVEKTFAAADFKIVAPEELSWQEQVRLFAHADIIAGEHGSGMKNLLFARTGAVQIVINHLNHTQATLAAMKQQPCVILRADGFEPSDHQKPFRIDPSRLDAAIAYARNLQASR